MWKDYFPAIDAIVFLIDASKTDRFKEAKTELDALLEEEQKQTFQIRTFFPRSEHANEHNF